ncbi:MAG TPA: hypothetical protein VF713_15235, partial [Thermoanaerobaculia bacterium]
MIRRASGRLVGLKRRPGGEAGEAAPRGGGPTIHTSLLGQGGRAVPARQFTDSMLPNYEMGV